MRWLRDNWANVVLVVAVVTLGYHVLGGAERRDAAQIDPDSSLLETGWQRFGAMDTQAALACFRQVLEEPDRSAAEHQQAHYGLILCRAYGFPQPLPTEALAAIEDFLGQRSGSDLTPWLLVEKGGVLQRLHRGAEARAVYRQVLDEHSDSDAIHEAALALANSHFYELTPEHAHQGLAILEDHIAQYPDNPLARVMLYRLTYRLAETNRQYAAAAPYARRLGHLKMCDPFRWGMLYWLLGQMHYRELDQPEEAITWYRRIIDECAFDARILSAKQMIRQIEAKQEDAP